MDPLESQFSEQPVLQTNAPVPSREPLANEIQTLRLGLLLLLIGVILLSVCFALFIYKQNNLLLAQMDAQMRYLNQNESVYENSKKRLSMLLQDLQPYTQTHGDIMPILVKYNFARAQPPPTTPAPLNLAPAPAK